MDKPIVDHCASNTNEEPATTITDHLNLALAVAYMLTHNDNSPSYPKWVLNEAHWLIKEQLDHVREQLEPLLAILP